MSTSQSTNDMVACSCCNDGAYIRAIIKKQLLNVFHPVNSLYISADSVDPSELFGGVWERVSDGLLYSTTEDSDVGTYGGSKKITTDHLPSHNHTFTGDAITGNFSARPYSYDTSNVYAANGCFRHTQGAGVSVNNRFSRSSYSGLKSDLMEFNATPSGTISNTGEGMDYLPYHFKVAVWRRTA